MALNTTTTWAPQWGEPRWTPEMADLVDDHWKASIPTSFALHVVTGTSCLGLGMIALFGNFLVIYIFSRTRGLQNASNALIVNLAVADFCMMTLLSPILFVNSLYGRWIFGANVCRFYGFSGSLFGTASIITMAGIALERYLVICRPLTGFKKSSSRRRPTVMIIFIWIYSFSWATPPLFGLNQYVLEGFLTTCSFDYLDRGIVSRAYILAMCVGVYVLPLMMIGFAYGSISWKVCASRRFQDGMVRSRSSHSVGRSAVAGHNEALLKKQLDCPELKSSLKRSIKMAKITFMTVVCWTVAWTPYTVVALMGFAAWTSLLTPLVAQLPAIFAKTAACYNPVVMCWAPTLSPVLSKQLAIVCRRKRPLQHLQSTSSSAQLVSKMRNVEMPVREHPAGVRPAASRQVCSCLAGLQTSCITSACQLTQWSATGYATYYMLLIYCA
ncbi:Melanopsin [Hypsibius exemplaris]|uniref:Melanopsin n=1 Tax=Hypsibius exemplaris TaxID=2072580 RepID=A0A9X6NEX8_HYPEX|nr:Melanopsin [Hypsibius exemplaris]